MDALGCSSGSFIFTDPFDTRMGCKKASAQGTTDSPSLSVLLGAGSVYFLDG